MPCIGRFGPSVEGAALAEEVDDGSSDIPDALEEPSIAVQRAAHERVGGERKWTNQTGPKYRD